jgi:selenide, water dikinase
MGGPGASSVVLGPALLESRPFPPRVERASGGYPVAVDVQTGPVRLTQLSHGAGCACKLGPEALESLLEGLGDSDDPALLVGAATRDDAAVYRLSEELALVQTADFFTPIVDDPYDFGRIAAANALSDVYAMGGEPRLALNLVAFPLAELGSDVLGRILRGGAEIAAQAGVAIAGGHSIDDPEPKYGMAVTGVAHPEDVVRNSTARAGDVLFLTKPIGGGVVTTQAKRGNATAELIARCTEVMVTLNRSAAEAASRVGVSAMTDVTGFGLIGHLRELVNASGVGARVEAGAVPVIDGVQRLVTSGDGLSGGSRRNRAFLEQFTSFDQAVPDERRALLFDAMTSGGLLIAASAERATEMEQALVAAAPQSARIGELTAGEPGRIRVE